MTGESMPVEKSAGLGPAPAGNALDLDNLVFMGTNVVLGLGRGGGALYRQQQLFRRAGQRASSPPTARPRPSMPA
jgi:hypothetical protein